MKLFTTIEEAQAYCNEKSINDVCREFDMKSCKAIE